LQVNAGDSLFIKGSFIQPHLVTQWNDIRWQEEFKTLKEAGLEFLIFMHTVHTSKEGKTEAVYPSKLPDIKSGSDDLLENCLRNAKRAGFKVFVGLNFNEGWWDVDSLTPKWIMGQMELGNKVAEELINCYKERYSDTMYGWYWVWEVVNSCCKKQFYLDCLIDALNVNLDFLHQHTEDMPFLLSPFMNSEAGTPEECSRMWQYILSKAHFKDGDIFAPQDCVGAGWLTIDVVAEWFKSLSKAIPSFPKIHFWANIEMFDQRFWTVAPLGRLKLQMDLLRPYVSGFISFAYSHYYSPALKNPLIHNSYVEYVQKGTLPICESPLPVSNLRIYTDENKDEVILEWKPAKEKKGVMGYHVYRDDVLIGNVQYDHNNVCRYKWNIQGKLGTYSVTSYDICGTESEKIALSLVK